MEGRFLIADFGLVGAGGVALASGYVSKLAAVAPAGGFATRGVCRKFAGVA